MKPVKFKGYNAIFAENQPEYQSLPAHKSHSGAVTSCWALTWRERFRLLFTGRLYLSVLSFGPLQPQLLSVHNPVETSWPEDGGHVEQMAADGFVDDRVKGAQSHYIGALQRAMLSLEAEIERRSAQNDYEVMFPEGDVKALEEVLNMIDRRWP